ELVLGEEAGEAERQRPYVEVLRLALAGHPAPRSALGVVTATRRPSGSEDPGAQVRQAWELVHASAFERLGPLLAGLIPTLEAASRERSDAEQSRVLALLGDAYQVAAAMLVKVGDRGAGWLAADRAISAGERCGDPSLVMAAQLRMAHTFVDSSEDELALHVLRQAVEIAGSLRADADPGLVSLTGACALLLAVLEARRGQAAEGRRHLKAAAMLARRLGSDRNDFGTEFGPTNVGLHQVAVAVELGNAAEALELADKVDPSGLSGERRARFLVDVARAHAQRRAVAAAVAALTEAEMIAPAEVNDSRLVRELLGDLEHLASGRQMPGLRALRRHATHS
ncbi:MAG: helix-turn-helix domain-containing protein, partial [Acidimicrobiales bacterium]